MLTALSHLLLALIFLVSTLPLILAPLSRILRPFCQVRLISDLGFGLVLCKELLRRFFFLNKALSLAELTIFCRFISCNLRWCIIMLSTNHLLLRLINLRFSARLRPLFLLVPLSNLLITCSKPWMAKSCNKVGCKARRDVLPKARLAPVCKRKKDNLTKNKILN